MSDNIFICKICNKSCSTLKGLSHHLHFIHNLLYKTYFNTYIEPWFHKCPHCDKERKWSHSNYLVTCGSKLCVIEANKEGYINSNEQRKITCYNKFGCEYPGQSAIVQEKRQQSCIKKYGVSSYTKTEECKEKAIQTNLKKYGVRYPAQNQNIKEKMMHTQKEKYGGIGFASNELFNKHKNYCLNKYGAEFPLQNQTIKIQQQKSRCLNKNNNKYYNNIRFDSNTELLFYKYCLSRNLNIICKPEPIKYIDNLNHSHLYFPDFKINNQLYEIKGSCFFDKNNEYKTPWVKGLTEEEIFIRNIRDMAKYKCMQDNNVIIILDTEVNELIKTNSIDLIKKFLL